jgi:hypothetical protein
MYPAEVSHGKRFSRIDHWMGANDVGLVVTRPRPVKKKLAKISVAVLNENAGRSRRIWGKLGQEKRNVDCHRLACKRPRQGKAASVHVSVVFVYRKHVFLGQLS